MKGANLLAQTEKRDGAEITSYGDFFAYAFLIYADQIRDVVIHHVHRVMIFMAMERPITWIIGDKLDGLRRSWWNIDGCLRYPCALRNRAAIGGAIDDPLRPLFQLLHQTCID